MRSQASLPIPRPGVLTQSRQYILTKGDNNELTDESLYPADQDFVYRHQIVGVVRGYVPYLGWPVILLNSYPWIRILAILLGCVVAIISE